MKCSKQLSRAALFNNLLSSFAADSNCIDQLVKKNIPLMVVEIMKKNSRSSIIQKVMAAYSGGGHVKSISLLWQRCLTYGFCLFLQMNQMLTSVNNCGLS